MKIDPMKDKREALLYWDECDIVSEESKYRMEHKEDFFYPNDITEEKIREDIWKDSSWWMDQYTFFYEALTELIQERQKRYSNKNWLVTMHNFGWRGTNGWKILEADNGEDFLQGILPKAQCTFYIFPYQKTGLKIQNFHHDSPVGNEWYYATLHSLKDWKAIIREERYEN